ncbi:hypothetical protein EMIT0232MI5_180086 [Pseudomonas sp. IT-232MI5]
MIFKSQDQKFAASFHSTAPTGIGNELHVLYVRPFCQLTGDLQCHTCTWNTPPTCRS